MLGCRVTHLLTTFEGPLSVALHTMHALTAALTHADLGFSETSQHDYVLLQVNVSSASSSDVTSIAHPVPS